jgi:2-C-methyl-D-erythritol 2,4-cyclodiphosphate synthase
MEVAGQPLVVGGVKFDGSDAPSFELGCVAHSDGDVIYHSVVDAILGALSMPDIGQLFPDNDPRIRGANSEVFMEEAYKRMIDRGYQIGNCDVTLILQKPKVNVEHNGRQVKGIMSANLARLLRTSLGQVNVKARTHEKLDSVGEGRAVECHVVLTLEKR